ncbi:Ig-like domain repeat protein [Granulicella cerasi]|uniref:Ig-like domain repeat protein n=1 Tax=Granulicella cerasi TaxID=741063 RepID=A0ABW1ZB12_9BACT|nr:Ig-like domain repeat protein [Granulicella cerasi]
MGPLARFAFPTTIKKSLQVVLAMSTMLGVGAASAVSQIPTVVPGSVAVGVTSSPVSVTVTPTASGAGSAVASTQGATTSEYTVVSGGTCDSGAYTSGVSCTVNVTLKPLYPGMRLGVVRLISGSGTVLGQTLLAGTATGSLAVIKPGLINTVVGSGDWTFRVDGVLATSAQIFLPTAVTSDAAGNLYVSDSNNNRIRKVTASTGLISTIAGSGTPGLSGDGSYAVNASISSPSGIVVDGANNVYFVDTNNNCVRRVDAATTFISAVAGTCGVQGYTGDGAAATSAKLSLPEGLALAVDGSLYIADTGNNVVRKVDGKTGLISTIAGTGAQGYNGDGIAATSATLTEPWQLALGIDGSLYIADLGNNRVRAINPSGTIRTVAGNGDRGYHGDAGLATVANLNAPAAVAVDPAGNVYIGDSGNNVVREVLVSTGIISTVAGTANTTSFGGDTGLATNAGLYGPYALSVDQTGNLLIADMFHNRVRSVAATNIPLSYDTIRVSKTSAPQALTLENDGNAAMNITGFTFDQSALDAATTTCAAGAMAISTTCTLGVEFAPTTVGNSVTGTLTVNSDAANVPTVVTLTGQVLTVNPTTTALVSSANPSIQGNSVTFTATVSSGGTSVTGTVDFLDGSTKICSAVTLSGTSATCATAGLTLGSHTITAVYSGDSENAASTSPAVTQVVKQSSTLTLGSSANPITVTQSLTLTASIAVASGTPTGTVSFLSDGVTLGTVALTSAGTATYTTSSLAVGTHAITATYSGDTSNAPATSTAISQVVSLANTTTTIALSQSTLTVGDNLSVSATVTSSNGPQATGSVEFLDGTVVLGSSTLAAGAGSFTTAGLAPGTHSITVKYLGDTDNATSTSSPMVATVNQADTTTTLTSDKNPASAGAVVTLTAVVAPSLSTTTAGTIGGTVTFYDGSTTLGTGTLDATGKATLAVSTLSVGTHTLLAKYNASTNYASSTSTSISEVINKTATTTTLAASGTGLAGKALTLTATVISSTGTPTGTVNFFDGATNLGTATLSASGVATLSLTTLATGNHSITATYVGDSNYTTSTSTAVSQTISLATVTLTLAGPSGAVNAGTAATFTAASASTGVTPTGSITLLDGSTTIATQAIAATNTFSISTLAVGSHSLHVAYAGDTDNSPASSNVATVVVQQGTTTTAITTSKTPQTLGSAVTFTATVTSASPSLTGTVSFYDGSTLLGGVALSNGVATLTTSTLTFGTHSITAAYVGDTNHGASTSPALSQSIVQAATAALTSSANPAVAGASVTFTAKLSGNGTVVPSGPVVFSDGAASLASVNLDASGTAVFTTTSLAVGAHSITVSYAGDTNYSSVTSAAIIETITNADTQVAISSSANPATYGSPLVFTAKVTSNGGTATGKLNFLDGTTVLGTSVLDATGTATLSTSTLAPGTHTIVASYAGDGKASASVSPSLSQTVLQTSSVAVSSSANPSLTLASITFTATVTNAGQDIPAGAITFTDGSTSLGTATLDASGHATLTVASMAAGTHSIVAAYAGNGTNLSATSPALSQVVDLRDTTTTLSAATSSNNAQQVTLIAVVRYTGPTAPTGVVTFTEGSTTLGTGTVDSTGVATMTLAVGSGSQTVTASYSGDASYAASTSGPTVVSGTTTAPFTVALNPSTYAMTSGQHEAGSVSVTSVAPFADTLEFGCLGLPSYATCTFSKTTTDITSGGTVSVQLTVDTGDPLGAGASANASKSTAFAWMPCGTLALAILFGLRRRKRLASLLLLVFTLATMGVMTGCGGISQKTTPAGNYTFQVVVRGKNTGNAVTQTVTLNVK